MSTQTSPDQRRLTGLFSAVRRLIDGGWPSMRRELRHQRQLASLPAEEQAGPGSGGVGRIGVMAHVYYTDLLDEFARYLSAMPVPYTLLVSVVSRQARQQARKRLRNLPNLQQLDVAVVPNQGRDIAPLLVHFARQVQELDVVCHIHTKKSLFAGRENKAWRTYLLDHLLGSGGRIDWILQRFTADPELGMVYPEAPGFFPFWGHTWLKNKSLASGLAGRLGVDIDPGGYLDYPVGSMFWARTSALRPLYDLHLGLRDFPAESGQTDGTLHHTLERFFGLSAEAAGQRVGVLPRAGELRLLRASDRNVDNYFEAWAPGAEVIARRAEKARLVSFDLFDTLVCRPFLSPDGARQYLAHRIERELAVTDFEARRKQAESQARRNAGSGDVGMDAIYREFAVLLGGDHALADRVRQAELAFERHTLRPRKAFVAALEQVKAMGRRVVILSDMYLGREDLVELMTGCGIEAGEEVYVSSETGLRKDNGSAWRKMPKMLDCPPGRWLHVGDNEQSDVQFPVDLRFPHPVPVLRPAALLEVVPALRGLAPATSRGNWQEQLWLGLVANRLAELADTRPDALRQGPVLDQPEDLGYIVLGPLVLNYLLWLGRAALDGQTDQLLFLARGGYVLKQAFERLSGHVPALARVRGSYFLTSRRAVNVAGLRSPDDLEPLLSGYFGSTEGAFLEARLGPELARLVTEALADGRSGKWLGLPRMKDFMKARLGGVFDVIGRRAEVERQLYLDYWRQQVTGERPALADLGFGGTIQSALMGLTGERVDGYYFLTTEKVRGIQRRGAAVHGLYGECLDEDVRACTTPTYRYGLFLESILAAPHGQFLNFRQTGEATEPVYKEAGLSQQRFRELERVHQGLFRFIDDVAAVVGDDLMSLRFDLESVQEPLRRVCDGRWSLGALESLFSVEDDYSGRGELNVLQDFREVFGTASLEQASAPRPAARAAA